MWKGRRRAQQQQQQQQLEPDPLLSLPLRRVELRSAAGFIGAGYDAVDVRIATTTGEPVDATFMLDSGLTTNLLTPELYNQLDLPASDTQIRGAALGGATVGLLSTFIPGLEILGESPDERFQYAGVWEGDGWRAWCSLDWEDWVARSEGTGGRVDGGTVRYCVLPAPNMTEAQLESLVGRGGTETVEGEIIDGSAGFIGRGVSVEPKGFLKVSERYEFARDGDGLLETTSGMRLSRRPARPSCPLRGPLHASCTSFVQSEVAESQGVRLGGMLGQFPLYQQFGVDIDPKLQQLSLHAMSSVEAVAASAGLARVPGSDLPSGLMAVQLSVAPLLAREVPGSPGAAAPPRLSVPAMVDTGSANTIVNWPAAELLLGIRRDDAILRDAPILRAVGLAGVELEFPLLTLSVGLNVEDGSLLRPEPIRVAIGDANIFEVLVGREETGSWPFGLGPRELRPAALLGQDILSQRRYLIAAQEPAIYMTPGEPASSASGRLSFEGLGDCVDAGGRRLHGLQKLACTPDDAASACLSLPAGACQGVAVTPLAETSYSGLCYVFVSDSEASRPLEQAGFKRYEAPLGQELAPLGAAVAAATGTAGAECYSWRGA